MALTLFQCIFTEMIGIAFSLLLMLCTRVRVDMFVRYK